MPFTRNYKQGAIIYFTGDKGEDIYILKSGLVTLTYKSIENPRHTNMERIKEGDFFGVKSALGHFKREETAEAKSDCTVLVLKLQEFEDIASKNIAIIIKMLKIFSTQLRKIAKQAELLMSQSGEDIDTSSSLFKLGEYYLRNGQFEEALYAFHKYIEHFPNSNNVYNAQTYIEMAKRKERITYSSDDTGDNLSRDEKEKEYELSYDKALKLINKGEYNTALASLEEIENKVKSVKANNELSQKVSFKKVFCYFKLEDYKGSINKFTEFIKKNPKTNYMKEALFYIGLSYKELEMKDKAISFLRKVSTMTPEEEINRKAINIIDDLTKI